MDPKGIWERVKAAADKPVRIQDLRPLIDAQVAFALKDEGIQKNIRKHIRNRWPKFKGRLYLDKVEKNSDEAIWKLYRAAETMILSRSLRNLFVNYLPGAVGAGMFGGMYGHKEKKS
jgi:hypothetical protein